MYGGYEKTKRRGKKGKVENGGSNVHDVIVLHQSPVQY